MNNPFKFKGSVNFVHSLETKNKTASTTEAVYKLNSLYLNLKLNTMKKLLLLLVVLAAGCSSDEECHDCKAKFFDPETREEVILTSDCNHTPPSEYFVFISHTKH